VASKSRRKSRELALKALYGISIGDQTLEESLVGATDGAEIGEDQRDYAATLVNGIVGSQAAIDAKIAALAEGYTIDRLAAVDLAILRIAVYEILFVHDVPPAVAINEAVDLAKKYSTESSGAFVNGILGNLVKQEGLKTHGDRAES
jgi:N utilization substance protein B